MKLDSEILQVPIEDIIPNRFQPRLSFDDKALQELSNSIKQHGIIQPLVLRKLGDKYEIIAGERRYKAATMAGLTQVPAVIANIDDNTSAEVALVENVQRKDLTPIEEAKSYKNILDKGYMTQEGLAKKMGLSQSAIANKLRLLNLAEEVQDALLNEKISERHARALLVIESQDEQRKWLKRILEERLTVRQLDMELKKELNGSDSAGEAPIININPNIEEIKSTATDINPEPQQNKNFYEAPVNKVQEDINPMPNKFFNFLEDEAVNMNMDVEQPTPNIFNSNPTIEENNEIELTEAKEETFVAPVIPQEEVEEEIESLDDDFNVLTPPTIEEIPVVEPTSEMLPIMNDDDYVDPISMIDTLDPEYEEKQKIEEGRDLKTAINSVRGCVEALNDKGFIIDIEELDLDNNYQINIKINKE